MPEFTIENEDGPILVQLAPVEKSGGIGYRDMADKDQKEKEDAEKSEVAMKNALETVYRTAKRVSAMVGALGDDAPQKAEIEFAISLKENSSAVIAKTGMDAHFRVKLTWAQDDD